MTPVYVDAEPLVGLGAIGRLDLLEAVGGTPLVPLTVREVVTTEPARTNLRRARDRRVIRTDIPGDGEYDEPAMAALGTAAVSGDVRLIAAVLEHAERGAPVAVLSDDRRVRTLAAGLGATVTGTFGVVWRAVADGLDVEEGKAVLDALDDRGHHSTRERRRAADELLEQAAGRG